jgi:hypothetical protein
MKSRSPFKAKIDIFQGSTSTYRHPSTVIQPIVGAQVGAQIAKTASEVTVKAIEAKSEKPKEQFDFKAGPKPKAFTVPPYKHDFSQKPNGGTGLGYRTIKTDQANTGVGYDESFNKLKKGKDGKALPTGDFKGGSGRDWEKYVRNYNTKNIDQERDEDYDINNNLTSFSDWRNRSKSNSPNTMKGSPVKHDPGAVGSIENANPLTGGIAGIGQRISNQAKQRAADAGGSTGVDPFLPPPNQVAETGSYSGGRDRILEMDSNPVINQSIGRDTNIASQLFGSGQRASMLAMKGPLYDKGHPDDYDGHTHRKKGASYKEGDLMDETDMETSYPKLHTQDVGAIKRDKKSQFMVSKNEDYNPTKIDTIRPLKGKEFKMGWGDAERNISTNPKYKKSK